MQLIRHAVDLKAGGRCVSLAIGVFDGMHLGHQQIIRQTIADARQRDGVSLVVTFDRHPNAIVAPDQVPPLICPLTQKLRAIESLGVDATLLIKFDRPFSLQAGGAFIRSLASDIGRLQSICVGADFVFGFKRSGNVSLLRKLGEELNFAVHGMAGVALEGNTISSTRIRGAIQAGDFDAVNQMLGRTYSISGTVVTGDQLGRKLGFPTANLDVTGLVLPPNGVYAAHTTVKGVRHRSVLNIGLRPTVSASASERRFEVHLLDFTGDIYGQEPEVEFATKLRDELKFTSLNELRSQIAADIAAAAECF